MLHIREVKCVCVRIGEAGGIVVGRLGEDVWGIRGGHTARMLHNAAFVFTTCSGRAMINEVGEATPMSCSQTLLCTSHPVCR